MTDPARPLFHRAAQMALPPGSVFKTATAVALLESGTARPEDTVFCRGYLHTPDRLRCYIYGRYGIGHDEIALADALAQSCNVYFFHFAGQMGAEPLVQWAARFGFGRRTGLDLPGESAGQLPTPQSIQRQQQRPWSLADTQALAIGQSSLTATPLQVARMMAAVANGGRLVTPHVASHLGLAGSFQQDDPAGTQLANAEAQPIDALHASTLSAVREGLRRTIADPNGTAYQTVRLEHPSIAGKTGTAETGGGRKDHAWLAGYVPAQRPRYAFVVVLEHAGGGAAVAGPVVRRLILRMESLGYFGRTRVTRTDEADRSDKR